MQRLRIEEAIARARLTGKKIYKKDIAKVLWEDSAESARGVNFCKLVNGRSATIRIEWVKPICEICGCSADFLFGMSND